MPATGQPHEQACVPPPRPTPLPLPLPAQSLSLPGVSGLHVMPLTKSARQLTLEFLADGTLPSSDVPAPPAS